MTVVLSGLQMTLQMAMGETRISRINTNLKKEGQDEQDESGNIQHSTFNAQR
jgi:hypothetical protein